MKLIIFALLVSTQVFSRSISLPLANYSNNSFEDKFNERCLKDTVASECQAYAAILRNELIAVLSLMEQSSHSDTRACCHFDLGPWTHGRVN